MKKYIVSVREVHVSHREVVVEDGATRDEIIEAADDFDEDYLEYSHTLDSDHTTIEEIPWPNAKRIHPHPQDSQ